jgi:hypothetical protein
MGADVLKKDEEDNYKPPSTIPVKQWPKDKRLESEVYRFLYQGLFDPEKRKEYTREQLLAAFLRDLKRQYPELPKMLQQSKVPAATFSALLIQVIETIIKPEPDEHTFSRILLRAEKILPTIQKQLEDQKKKHTFKNHSRSIRKNRRAKTKTSFKETKKGRKHPRR